MHDILSAVVRSLPPEAPTVHLRQTLGQMMQISWLTTGLPRSVHLYISPICQNPTENMLVLIWRRYHVPLRASSTLLCNIPEGFWQHSQDGVLLMSSKEHEVFLYIHV